MTYRWTPELRDALIYAEASEILAEHDQDSPEAVDRLSASMVALTSIPLNSTLEPTEDDLAGLDRDGDVEPGPTWAWVNQLATFYYGHSATIGRLEAGQSLRAMWAANHG